MQLDDTLHTARRLRKNKLEYLARLLRFLDPLHLLQLLHTALHLGSLGGHGTEAVNEGLDVINLALLIAPSSQKLEITLLLQLQEAGVIPRIAHQRGVLDVIYRLHQFVHEIAIV